MKEHFIHNPDLSPINNINWNYYNFYYYNYNDKFFLELMIYDDGDVNISVTDKSKYYSVYKMENTVAVRGIPSWVNTDKLKNKLKKRIRILKLKSLE